MQLDLEVQGALIKNIRRRMTPQPLKIRADIEMTCFQFDGVLDIKEAMWKAEAGGNNDCPVKIKLVTPPLYVLTTQTLDKFGFNFGQHGGKEPNILLDNSALVNSGGYFITENTPLNSFAALALWISAHGLLITFDLLAVFALI
ncbi:hypothetical protein HHK36_016132 [Tetracentron sinense]|uniref:Uncharacterized protein n=1 Tax=Tetracentron sinense TaxID=13715 RepID=A0A834Z565_TETSI|nr:hypothetical protein HHK36_016132 [Tetracentron sinense]